MLNWLTGFRKFALASIYLVIAVGLLILDIIPADGWLEQVTAVVVAFMGTNIGEHIINATKDMIKDKYNAK